jgi:zinc finger CCHC domain-containing protein 9
VSDDHPPGNEWYSHHPEPTNKPVMFNSGFNGGADEDDFHTFNRRKAEVEKDEKYVDKSKRSLGIKAGVHSGVVKSFAPKAAKKLSFFDY